MCNVIFAEGLTVCARSKGVKYYLSYKLSWFFKIFAIKDFKGENSRLCLDLGSMEMMAELI